MPSAPNNLVHVSHVDGVATCTLNRPDARNALSLAMIEAMHVALDEIIAIDGLRVLVMAGNGKSFCAGMDLKAVQHDPRAMGEMLEQLAAFNTRLRRVEVPTIARVQGAAIGGGCGLMVVCDFSITHPEAKLGYPEVDLGICPAVIAPWLIKRIGAGRARAMLLAGGTMSGEAGHHAGLATHLVAEDQLEHATAELAGRLCKGGPEALAATKSWLNELDGSLDDALLQKGAEISARMIQSDEAQERLRAVFGGT
ncbi:MAG: enoyl-CoA hydratase/isomerase family protein [Phycisphaerales bacterium]|nr:enoyl-CoA hydratase/isomerase family protein [Phycisphaerales bacterium]